MSQGKLIGRQFGKYELISLLGSGGMADVYSAYQPGPERMVAVKLMHGFLGTSPEAIARFKREARSVALLRHPNIIQLFDFDVHENIYYMVMEFIVGKTLAHYIYDRGALPLREVVNITIQLTDALQYAHSQGIIHRDIKPVNIMFADTDHRLPVLTDFGIARIMHDPVLTAASRPLGSPAYLSPEVARGRPADERTDIYSLGVTVYEMLTGRRPFESEGTAGILIQHAHATPPPLSQFNVMVPELMEAILQKMLAKHPKNRFQSAGELKAALMHVQAILTHQPDVGPSYAAPKPQPALYPSPSPVNFREGAATPFLGSADQLDRTAPSTRDYSTGRVATRFEEIEAQPTRESQPPKRSRREAFFVPLLVLTAFILGMFIVVALSANNANNGVLPTVPGATATQPAAIVQTTLEPSATETLTSVPTTLVPSVTPSVTPSLTATDVPTAIPTATVEVLPSSTPEPVLPTATSRIWPTQERRELKPTSEATQVPTLRPTANVASTQVPVIVQPTSVPVQPTSVPVQPTSAPPPQPTSPPPQPTSPPIIPPVVPTVLAPIKTLLPGL